MPADTIGDYDDWGGVAIVPHKEFFLPTTSQSSISGLKDRPIEAGAVITMRIIEDRYNPAFQPAMAPFPPSTIRYENIEEWFIESNAYNAFVFQNQAGDNVGADQVTFRRGYDFTNLIGGAAGCVDEVVTTMKANSTHFSTDPVYMMITGLGTAAGWNLLNWTGCSGNPPNVIHVSINIQQTENLATCETVPLDSDTEIYHETTRTYPISGGRHKVLWAYSDFTDPAGAVVPPITGTLYTNLGQLIPDGTSGETEPHYFQVGDQVEVHTSPSPFASIPGTHTVIAVNDKYNIVIDLPFPGNGAPTGGTIGFYHAEMEERDQTLSLGASIIINPTTNTNSVFNAYAFGNGVESDRIRDNFNSTTLEYSPRSIIAIESYEQERKESALVYSGTYKAGSSINGLNEFNLSLANFKNLDIEFGSVQKLYSRDSDIVVFQEDKISTVLYGKNLLSDAVGGGSIVSIPEVLGLQMSDEGEWGISFNPESFAQWGDDLFWTDSRRGSVLAMKGDQIIPIVNGMKSYFRDLMRNDINTQKIGVYDPFNHHYIIASNDYTSKPCSLILSKYSGLYPADIADGPAGSYNGKPDYSVISNAEWTAEIVYSSGSGWVTGFASSGFGNEAVYLGVADNLAASPRTATITYTFCGGLELSFVLTQGGVGGSGQGGTNGGSGSPAPVSPGSANGGFTVHPWVLTVKEP